VFDDGEGFNVSIQFDIKIHNTTEILDYNVTMHYIEGYVEDVHELLLYDITNGTYCFNWVAIWTDEEGQQHTITNTWENIVMNGTQGDD
jgi:ketol-acid reductoisomerase